MSARVRLVISALLLAACAGGSGIQVGDGDGTRLIIIHLGNPHSFAHDLEQFVNRPHQEARPAVDLRQRLKEPGVTGAWESLEPWERQLWSDYAARGRGRADPKRTNFHVTDNDRLYMALDLSLDYMPPAAREEGRRLLQDPAFLSGLVSGIGLYILLWIYPEPAFTKGIASVITTALLLQFSVQEIYEFAWAWRTMDQELAHAQTLAAVENAAAKFGRSAGARAFHILMIIASKLAGKALEGASVSVGGAGPPMAAAGAGLALAEGQEIWILQGGVVALAGPGALTVAMTAAGNPEEAPSSAGDLEKHESSGGHLLQKHVGKTEAELAARLAAERKLPAASTFLSRAEAESAVSTVLRTRHAELASWLAKGAKGTLELDASFKGGLVLQRGATSCVTGQTARIVLRGDGRGGWFVMTGYMAP